MTAKFVIFTRGPAEDWTRINPILRINQIGREADTRKFKIGNGVTSWNDLEYQPGLLPEWIDIRVGVGGTGA